MSEEAGELDPLARRIVGLRRQNAQMVQRIERAGGGVETSLARLEHFLQRMVEWGVITEEQFLVEQEAWELHLRESLKPILQRLEAPDRKPKKKLWTPGS